VPAEVVSLLDADPDLARDLGEAERAEARQYAVARVERVAEGPWDAQRYERGDAVALLVLDGLLTRDLRFETRTAAELLGAGDLLRPWQEDERHPGVHVAWRVHQPVRFAVIDRRLMLVAARWPALSDALLDRALGRARAMTFSFAVSQMKGIDRRLAVVLWDAANRWGRVTPDGVRVELRLTHETLAQLVGARRPSVSLALRDLSARGEIVRDDDGWLLRGEPPAVDAPSGELSAS
jgi:CRP-like cAMP-binding protein